MSSLAREGRRGFFKTAPISQKIGSFGSCY
nr:MAG TPA: hypothetical protein [Caudoviricetes sp.]